ncbi:TatD family hydrolase [uncultured Negativibacillus sp.]|uniref:TatD family hydrolase n=1 Tax=uncultured Negativibacillus sp. TaxID=1980696 RepID=UPI0025E60D45|nr:TatD family hydrolase [uncultured Negativibacillus sp.]
MQNIFDSHAHYDDPRFDDDRDTLLSSMASNGVRTIMNVGNTTSANVAGIELAKKYPFVYCSIGIHPDQSAEIAAQNSRDYLDVIAQQLSYEKAMALGEIGLDYYYDDDAPRDIQKKIFEEQLALAKDLDVPVIIHNRDAHQDTLELLKKYRPKGIMHCFSSSAEVAKEVLRLGMYIGFTGVITFKNARRAVEAAAEIPLDRLLVETDCPYMAPEPYRGKRCDSTMLPRMVEKLAQIKGIDPQQLADQTFQNACAVYNIPLSLR